MRKGTISLKTGGKLLAMMAVFLLVAGAVSLEMPGGGQLDTGADLIMIDTLKAMGPSERPPVAFFHSRHTEALAKINRDCSVCRMCVPSCSI